MFKENRSVPVLMCLVIALFLSASLLFPGVVNEDKPLNGEWDFKLKKIWEIDSAGETPLANPGQMLVLDDGSLCVQDTKHGLHFIFDGNGKLVKSFGKRGEGPGEIRRIDEEEMFLYKDKIIISDSGKIHYFTKDGNYIRSAANTSMKRMPLFFLDEKEFVFAPVFRKDMPGGKGQLGKYNLETAKETVISGFSLANGGKDEGMPEIVMGAITPLMVLGYDGNKFYFGMSDTYTISVADPKGNKIETFSLDRAKVNIRAKEKKAFFSQWNDPPELVNKWIKTTPDEFTFFSNIEVHHGLIYIYKTFNNLNGQSKSQEMDLFSPSGKYLYKGSIKPGKGLEIYYAHRRSIVIKKGHLYLLVKDEDGAVKVAKYTVDLPEMGAVGSGGERNSFVLEDLKLMAVVEGPFYSKKGAEMRCAREPGKALTIIEADRRRMGERYFVVKKEAVVTLADFMEVSKTPDMGGAPAISFKLKDGGADRLKTHTSANIGKPLAIVLNGKAISAPIVQSPIDYHGMIVGKFEKEEIDDLVAQIGAAIEKK